MATLTPSAKQQFFDANGNPLAGGKLYTYTAGTTTPLATYADASGGTPNTNPIILDSRGEANIWLGTAAYKFKLTTSTDVEVWTVDNVQTDYADALADLAASGGSSLVGFLQSGSGATARTVQSKLRDVVSVKDFGAVGDGITDDTAALVTAFTACANDVLIVPDGSYLINNSSNPFVVSNFQGELLFFGNAKFVFNTNTKKGISFNGGTGARIEGIRISYQTPPSIRSAAQEGIEFYATTDSRINNAYVENSPAAGIIFKECIRPKVSNTVIVSSKADGVHFANCQDGQAVNITTVDTGDDGLAYVNYASGPAYTGGTATNIRIRNSKARGIAVVGQSDVTISNFVIDGTSSSGCYTAYEASYSTRVPENVLWENGLIKNAGTISPLVGNQYGIEFSAVSSVKYSGLRVVTSGNRGMSGITAGRISVSDVLIDTPALGSGIELTAGICFINGLTAISAPSYGIYISNCGTLLAQNLTAINCSLTDALKRGIGFQDNAVISVDGVNLIDNQATATGYNILINGTQAGWVSNIFANIVNGTFSYVGTFNNVAIPNTRTKATVVTGGYPVGNRFIGYASAAPVSGTYAVGDRFFNSAPTIGQPKSWVCTVAGTPGTWISEGNL